MTPLWVPSAEMRQKANLTAYMKWLERNLNLSFHQYDELWKWSVNRPDDFWKSVWQYFDVVFDGEIRSVKTGTDMPHITWFEGTSLNYAEHVFRQETADYPAIIAVNEADHVQEISWKQLRQVVGSLRQFMQTIGVQPGDRIAAYLPCIPEATMAFLATSSLGAVWSSCSPDFGLQAVVDRFAQIEPVVLFATLEYRYNGSVFSRKDIVDKLIQHLPSLRHIVIVGDEVPDDSRYVIWKDASNYTNPDLTFNRVPFSHPLWILYSSGTTGLPKAMVHSHGGILLEHLKYLTFHNDIHPGERCFWFTTTGWMMWNYIQSCLLCRATLVLYDGSPAYPDLYHLWKMADEQHIQHFGTSAAFIMSCARSGIRPRQRFSLSALRSIGSTGSTLPPEGFQYIYNQVKPDVWLASISGGTDVCSAFVGGNPLLPVYSGEIQCRALGCRVEAFDEEGKAITGKVGEMVITQPLPSMPVYFWNDPEFARYRESYFEMYPKIWRHGDWMEITPRGGVIIYGRSDATLNRAGIRIGTSEIYRAMDKVEEVADSLIVCVEKPDGSFWMPLFVVLKAETELDEMLRRKISEVIRSETSPRHVPDEIIAVPDIPYTISGKKTETPVKKILMGKPVNEVVNPGALRNPESLNFFAGLARKAGYNKES
jgi:acetoacetyl-CoA synthetase